MILSYLTAGERLAINLLETVTFYDVGGCITLKEKIDIHDWQVLILAGNIMMEESVIFKAFVHKDTRTSWTTQDVRVSVMFLPIPARGCFVVLDQGSEYEGFSPHLAINFLLLFNASRRLD